MNRKAVFATIFAVLIALSPAAGVVGAAPAGGTDTVESVSLDENVADAAGPVEFGARGDVGPALQDSEGTVEVVFRMDQIDRASLEGLTGQAAIKTLKTHADATQQNLLRYAGSTEGIEVLERFWISNAVLTEVDTDMVSIEEVTRIKGVDRAHSNFQLERPEPVERAEGTSQGVESHNYNTTYGLEQINATKVWDEYNTMGEGVGIAHLDTGVSGDHPDIDIDPDNFVSVDPDGNVENVDPVDSGYHGTHTAGTATGGNASGQYIGVAPEAELYSAKVLGQGTFAQVAGGMEWAANQSGVDVVTMSLGAPGYNADLIEMAENIEDTGQILVASIGNDGAGNTGSPGNYYSSIGAGANNEAGEVATFSGGAEIDTQSAWGDAAPGDWPAEYTQPDYSAPGVATYSAEPGGGYQELSGTSMSAPHIAGAIALMESAAGGDLAKDMVTDALSDTAWTPVQDPDPARYGDGIIDVYNATAQVALDQEITGTVTGADGTPIEDAMVSTDQGFEAATNADGEYTVLAETGNVSVTADAFGAQSATETVEVGDDETVMQNFSLEPALGVSLESGQASGIEGGDNVSATVQVANLDTYTAALGDGYSAENATLYVNGDAAEFGEPIDLGGYSGMVTVTVETAAGTSGTVSVDHTFEGLGDTVEVTTGPTEVFEEYTMVGVVDDNDEYGGAVAATLTEQLPASYDVSVIDSDTAIESTDTYDAYVVQYLDDSNGDAFTSATASYDVGTVYLDQWGSGSNAIEVRSNALGDPAETGDGFSGENPSYVNVADHPIFEGVGDEPISLHGATFADKSWFSDTDAEVLADVSSGEVQGSGVAVSEARWDILGASLGYSTFTEGEYTEDADTILGNMAMLAANPPDPAGTVNVTDTMVSPGGTAEVSLQTDVSNVSGYEATINFDPEKLQVTDVSGEDMADPVMEVDNENGELFLTQAQAAGADAPQMASIEFEVANMSNGEEADVTLSGAESALYDPSGDSYLTNWDSGHVMVLEGDLGDVNADGEITAGDAVIVQRYIAGLPTEVPDDQIEMLGDVNQDGQITSADVTYILQIVAGIEEPPEMSASDTQSSVATPSVESTAAPGTIAL